MKRIVALLNLLALGLSSLASLQPAAAQVQPAPALMNFQGRLARPDGTPVADGTYSIRFSLWDSVSAGTEKWNQTLPTVGVANGVFNVLLDVSSPVTLFNGNLWLEIQIGTDVPLTPRQQLVSVAYAMKANSVPDGSIGASQIANGSVGSGKLANGAVGSAQLANGSVGTAQLADGGITAGKFAPNLLDPLAWRLGGNGVTNPTTQFLGTVGNQPLVFRTNNVEQLRLDSAGNVGIGTASPTAKLHVNGAIKVNGANVLELGAGNTKEANAGKFGYQLFSPDALDIIGAGTASTNRKIRFWAEGGTTLTGPLSATSGAFSGAVTAPSATVPTLNGNVSFGGSLAVKGVNTLELLGAGNTKEASAGKFGYQLFSPDALDIVGAGTTPVNRKIRFWAEGGTVFTGTLAATAGTFSGAVTAPSATIPTLNGNVSVGGELTAKVVTVTGGSDVAEPYEVAGAGEVKPVPGMVVAIDTEQIGRMRVASRAYDKTVAGILSGANGIAPGITLRQKGTVADGTLPVASIGRVWVLCDADANGAIEAGDMLTTSNTPGHAMKVSDYNKANGSVIGKAMSSLKSGKGLVLVLVSLK